MGMGLRLGTLEDTSAKQRSDEKARSELEQYVLPLARALAQRPNEAFLTVTIDSRIERGTHGDENPRWWLDGINNVVVGVIDQSPVLVAEPGQIAIPLARYATGSIDHSILTEGPYNISRDHIFDRWAPGKPQKRESLSGSFMFGDDPLATFQNKPPFVRHGVEFSTNMFFAIGNNNVARFIDGPEAYLSFISSPACSDWLAPFTTPAWSENPRNAHPSSLLKQFAELAFMAQIPDANRYARVRKITYDEQIKGGFSQLERHLTPQLRNSILHILESHSGQAYARSGEVVDVFGQSMTAADHVAALKQVFGIQTPSE